MRIIIIIVQCFYVLLTKHLNVIHKNSVVALAEKCIQTPVKFVVRFDFSSKIAHLFRIIEISFKKV